MNRKSVVYSAALLVALVLGALLLNRGVVQGLHSSAHVSVVTDESSYLLGQTIVFTGTLTLPASELTTAITRVRLINTAGNQPLDVDLPVEDTDGAYIDLSSLTSATNDTLTVKIDFTNITTVGGTLPGGSLPGTLPTGSDLDDGGNFLVTTEAATIAYEVR